MITYYADEFESNVARTHRWEPMRDDSSKRYYDFVKQPELIRSTLENLLPLGDHPAAIKFYELLEWLNGPDSLLESNDSGLGPMRPNGSTKSSHKRLEIHGRIILFFRDHRLNLKPLTAEALRGTLIDSLSPYRRGWLDGIIGFTDLGIAFTEMSPEDPPIGLSVQVSFWSWGDTEQEVWDNLILTLDGILGACKHVTSELRKEMGQSPT